MAALSITPAAPIHVQSVCKINVTGAAGSDASAYNAGNHPTEPELTYYLKFSKAGEQNLKSHTFSPSSDGKHEWDSLIIPTAGVWTLDLCKVSDNSVVATASVTVS